MPIGQVQQVAQPAARAMPALVADAVLQDDVVGTEGPQQGVHVPWGPLRVDLVHLRVGRGAQRPGRQRGRVSEAAPLGAEPELALCHAGHFVQPQACGERLMNMPARARGQGARALLNTLGPDQAFPVVANP